jgi:hypothetical protein
MHPVSSQTVAAAAADEDCSDSDSEVEDGPSTAGCTSAKNNLNETQEVGHFSRQVIHYLIQQYPLALLIPNNFQKTPVETVLEKVNTSNHKTKSKYKQILTWGLYDDPVTARILLLYQNHYFAQQLLPRGLKLQQMKILHELNWTNRKYVLLASYGNYLNYFLKETSSSDAVTANFNNKNQSTEKAKSASKNNNKLKGSSAKSLKNTNKNNPSNITAVSLSQLQHPSFQSANLLCQLRLSGHIECLQIIVSYV